MEQNMPIIAKKDWKIIRVAYFMLRKGGISKGKILADLNFMLGRGKIVGMLEAMHNLMQHPLSPHFPPRSKHTAPPLDGDLVAEALEMINSASESPVTDSPFPLREIEEDNHVDEAADEFINKFYKVIRNT